MDKFDITENAFKIVGDYPGSYALYSVGSSQNALAIGYKLNPNAMEALAVEIAKINKLPSINTLIPDFSEIAVPIVSPGLDVTVIKKSFFDLYKNEIIIGSVLIGLLFLLPKD